MNKSLPELDLLARLGAQASGEAQPTVDVSARVLRRIAQGRPRVVDPRLAVISVAACVLSVAALLALRPAKSENDSLAALSEVAVPGGGPETLFQVFEP